MDSIIALVEENAFYSLLTRDEIKAFLVLQTGFDLAGQEVQFGW